MRCPNECVTSSLLGVSFPPRLRCSATHFQQGNSTCLLRWKRASNRMWAITRDTTCRGYDDRIQHCLYSWARLQVVSASLRSFSTPFRGGRWCYEITHRSTMVETETTAPGVQRPGVASSGSGCVFPVRGATYHDDTQGGQVFFP